ncbi:MAG: hypothetical protein J0L70_28645 [Leptolyngbya sp. UWPOB_LEPTO1]|uniref:virulence-associated E family protein n=1 Tax=Leptolyngbya sp. UWPOB_LEPTO1 TaxID=2815653 RepID=UPI001AC31E59|nr:virulence-associated E family protein [Leptolyngbya sp. UWPOB_LEPTO1]MBN8564505.1 hypothetical protein [Leptolyngbya sp. UWPOB_LEPTO1]
MAHCSRLTTAHRDHLKSEGFSEQQIDWMHNCLGVQSITEAEARSFSIGTTDQHNEFVSSSGLYFPFAKGFGQIRCDDPPITGIKEDGSPKRAKYLTPCKADVMAWLPDGVQVVTEGMKDALAGFLHGEIATGALAGVSHYRKASNLKRGAGYTILFDSDGWTNPDVFTQLFKAGNYLKGKIQLVPPIPDEPKAGLCEYFKAGHTAADYRKLIDSALSPKDFLKELPKRWAGLFKDDREKCETALLKLCAIYLQKPEIAPIASLLGVEDVDEKLESLASDHASKIRTAIAKRKFSAKDLQELTGTYFWKALTDDDPTYSVFIRLFRMGDRLRFNTLKKRVEFDGEVVKIGSAKTWFSIRHNFRSGKIAKEDFADILLEAAEINSYSPIVEYLDQVSAQHNADTSILQGLAQRYFGQSDPTQNAMLLRTLIGAVARAYNPGCKMDTALILKGKQGFLKSSFFLELAGGDGFFTDSFKDCSDKDDLLKLHSVWIVEWAELETIFRKRDVSATKAFLTSKTDYVRPPYGRMTDELKRPSIIVGTTNEDEFLSDNTGNRRFWVVEVLKKIDIDLLRKERARIWAAAVALYKAGEQWWLTDLEETAAAKIAECYQTSDVWTEPVLDYVEDRDFVTTPEILDKALQVEISRQSKSEQMRIADILKKAGWKKESKRVDGKQLKGWSKPDLPKTQQVEQNNLPESEAVELEASWQPKEGDRVLVLELGQWTPATVLKVPAAHGKHEYRVMVDNKKNPYIFHNLQSIRRMEVAA